MNIPPNYLLEYAKRLPVERQAAFIRDWLHVHGELGPNDEMLKVMDLLLDLGLGNQATFENQNHCAAILKEISRTAGSREKLLETWAKNTLAAMIKVASEVKRSAEEAANSAKAAAEERLPWKKICLAGLLYSILIFSGVIAGDALLLSKYPATNQSAAEYQDKIDRLTGSLNEYESAYTQEENANDKLNARLKQMEEAPPPVGGGFEFPSREYIRNNSH